MKLIDKYLNQRRGEFDVYVRADIVQAIADGKYIADPSNEHKEWIDSMKGRPFIEAMNPWPISSQSRCRKPMEFRLSWHR